MRAWWLEKKILRGYRQSDGPRLFKWVVFTREGETQLVAIPADAGWVFHMEAIAKLAVKKRWCDEAEAEAFLRREGNEFPEADLRVLGGGVRGQDGSTRNFSYRFGPVPEPVDLDARRSLWLET
jgi:hypothetical protein